MPLLFTTFIGSKQDYNYTTHDTNVCKAMRSLTCISPRGKMFCGTAAMNAMYAVRGNPPVYDEWATKYCCDGWSFSDILPYFKKSENNTNKSVNPKYHSFDGPMKISDFYHDYGVDLVVNGVNESGVNKLDDINIPHGPGVFIIQGTLYDGRRWAVCKGYINPIQTRENLKILKCAVVTKILFDKNNTAIGVEFFHKGKAYEVYARHEVILSAGAFGTPVLLQLSGIGRSDDLAAIGVTPLLPNLPLDVGHYLWEHLSISMWFSFCGRDQSILDILDSSFEYYHQPRSGTFSGLGAANVIAYLDVPISNGTAIIECYFFLFEANSLFLQSASSFIPYNQEIQDHLAEINKEKMLLLAVPLLLTPKCHGSVRAKETGPTAFDKPHIHYNFLCEKNGFDEIALIQAMERIQTFPIRSKTWRASCAAFVRLPLPACDKPYLNETTNDYRKCYLPQLGTSMYHPAGTARMGCAPGAVCKSDCTVRGVKHLRVADASMFDLQYI